MRRLLVANFGRQISFKFPLFRSSGKRDDYVVGNSISTRKSVE